MEKTINSQDLKILDNVYTKFYLNDLEMMEVCGTGIAMGNGTDEIKQHADYVTDEADNDGIYKALKHFELI